MYGQNQVGSVQLRLALLDTIREVEVLRAETRLIALPKRSAAGKQWQLAVETHVEGSQRLVVLRSAIQVTSLSPFFHDR